MQMPISSTSTGAAPAASGAGSAKAADGAAFSQALVQTLAGAQAGNAEGQAGGEAAGVAVKPNLLASLLGGNMSATDLLAAIEAMIQKLDGTDAQALADTTSKDDLADALVQLDNLLSTLTGVPTMQWQALNLQSPDSAEAGTNEGSAQSADTLMAVLNAISQTATQGLTGLAGTDSTGTANPSDSDLAVITALKSGLQEALTDLRELLQQTKSGTAGREQTALISKQLASIEQLILGTKPESQPNQQSQSAAPAAVDQADSISVIQKAPAANSHLQRMSHQLLHVGLLNAVQKPQEQEAAASVTENNQDLNELGLQQVNGATVDLQRQLSSTTVKPVIMQPVPVQQFASTVQGLIVRDFNLSSGNGVSQAQLTLFPEHLGQVNVNISVHNGTLTAQFVTDSATAKDMLENQMAQLRSALQSQGLNVQKLEVSQTSVQPNLFQDRQGQQGKDQGAFKRNQSKNDAIGEIDFNAEIEELSTQQVVDRDLGLGRGIHTTA
ncbi:flagellar hook-length control protein FliK [Paenibacillus sp. R14(2021)]|uniref:flagellar hook-length control protein FliK n=1 Tax=Paenibacillus sp. R14(2021) TaxID=2859228 RepID=UPI001C616774|nr:flagellar hook-length control protein FliK [Paenibacillus sp. R14(2021)]